MTTLKFVVFTPIFWKTTLEKGAVYEQLRGQVATFRVQIENSIKKQTGKQAIPKELAQRLAPLFSLEKEFTTDRFRELGETNIDRLFEYLEGREKSMYLYLPVKEWKLPVEKMGQSPLSKLTARTPIEDALSVVGMKPEQIKTTTTNLGQVKTMFNSLTMIWVALLCILIILLTTHFVLGVGLSNQLGGTAWLVMISGFVVKFIGYGALNLFEMIVSNAKNPLQAWQVTLGRSVVSQLFQLGGTIGIVFGVIGLAAVVVSMYLNKKMNVKEKDQMSIMQKVISSVLGLILGIVLLILTVVGGVVLFGGKVNLKVKSDLVGMVSTELRG